MPFVGNFFHFYFRMVVVPFPGFPVFKLSNANRLDFHVFVLGKARHFYLINFQAFNHIFPGLRNNVSHGFFHRKRRIEVVIIRNIGLPRLRTVVPKARQSAYLRGLVFGGVPFKQDRIVLRSIHGVIQVKRRLGTGHLEGFLAFFGQFHVILIHKINGHFHKRQGTLKAVGKGFQHVGFRHKTDGIPQCRVPRGVPSIIAEIDNSGLRRGSGCIHVWNHFPFARLHFSK